MKLLVIWKRLSIGGINSGWRNRALYFSTQGIQTEFLYHQDKGGRSIIEPIANYYLTKEPAEIIHIIKNNNYDVLIIVDFPEIYPLIRQAEYNGKIIIESRIPVEAFGKRMKPKLERLLNEFPSDLVIAPSYYQHNILQSYLKREVPTLVIYNSIDTNTFSPITIGLSETKPPLTKNKKVIAWVGRLDIGKNWRMFLLVAKKILVHRQDVEFWVIGGKESQQKKDFIQEIYRLQLKPYFRWFPVVSYDNMPLLYSKVAQSGGCFFSTTKRESFGNVFAEAMACGCPVVAPNNTCVSEVVLDNHTGLLYENGSIPAAVQQILSLLNDTKKRNDFIVQGLQRVKVKFSTEVSGKEYVRTLEDLVSKKEAESI